MNSATSVAREGWIGLGQRISMTTQLRGALERVRRAAGPLVVLGVATCAIGLGGQSLAVALDVPVTSVKFTAEYVAYVVATTLPTSLLSAMALRALVRGPEGWFRLDGPLVTAAAVLGAMTLVIMGMSALFTQAVTGSPEPGQALGLALLMMAGYVGLLYGATKLSLWPIGIMMEQPSVTPAQSWRLMKNATRGLILGYVVLAIPLVIVAGSGSALMAKGAPGAGLTPLHIATTILGVAFAYCTSGLTATIYDLRVTSRAGVAEVFD